MKQSTRALFLLSLIIFTPSAKAQVDLHYTTGAKPFMMPEPPKGLSEEEKKCLRRLWLDLGDQTFEVSRTKSLTFTRIDNTKVEEGSGDHPFDHCDMIDVGKVTEFATGYKKGSDISIEASLPALDKKARYITSYQMHKDLIMTSFNDGKTEMLADGTKKIPDGNAVLYVLPAKILKTGNDEPVGVYCAPVKTRYDNETSYAAKTFPRACSARYVHPEGYGFGYTYLENAESDHFGMDILVRKKFQEMKRTRRAAPPAPAPQEAAPAQGTEKTQ